MEMGENVKKRILRHHKGFFLISFNAFSNFLAQHLQPQWLQAVCIHLPLCGSNIVQASI